MANLAAHIDVKATLRGNTASLTIDGEEFPWYITPDGVSVSVGEGEAPAVTITILAEQVTVHHGIDPRP